MSINQLPRYKSHKTVGASRITAFRQNGIPDAPDLVLGEIGSITTMLPEWHEKHKPYVGGYLVKYDDSYMSFSPAKAFEDGYRLVDTPAAKKAVHVGMTIAGNGAAMLGALMREQYANRNGSFKAIAAQAQPAPIVSLALDNVLELGAYRKVDRFLRNNLDDDDYEEYSSALSVVFDAAVQPVQPTPPLLGIYEQRAVLADLTGLECLINYHDCAEVEGDAIEPGWGANDALRSLELLRMGREIIATDPDIWSDTQKAAFKLRHSEIAHGIGSPGAPGSTTVSKE